MRCQDVWHKSLHNLGRFYEFDVAKRSAWLASSTYSQTDTFLANYRRHSRRRRLLIMPSELPQGGLRERGQLGQNVSHITSLAPVGFADHSRFRIQSHSYHWQKSLLITGVQSIAIRGRCDYLQVDPCLCQVVVEQWLRVICSENSRGCARCVEEAAGILFART